MRYVLKALSSYLFRYPGQLALAVIGMAVGVAVIIAVDIANESAKQSFSRSIAAITGEATHQIIGGPTGLDEQIYVDLRLGGIRAIAPIVEGTLRLNGEAFQVLGVDMFAESDFRDYQTDGEGGGNTSAISLLTTSDGVMMNARTAEKMNLKIGDLFTINSSNGEHTGLIAGLIGNAKSGEGLERILIVDIATAQEWMGLVGKLSRIDVRLGNGSDRHDLDEKLPADARLMSTERRNNSVLEMSTGFNTSLTAMSLFALLVGVFLIYNCMSFMVLQRRPIIGVLRALGVTRKEIVGAMLIEGLIVALIGVLLGLLAGKFLGEQLVSLVANSVNDHYYSAREVQANLSTLSVIKGVAAGILATLIAVTIPALEAVSYPPRLTLVRSVVEENVRNLIKWVALGAALLSVGASAVLTFSDVSLIAGFFALFLVIVSAALLVPLMIKITTPFLTVIMGWFAGLAGRIAVRGILKSLSRTGVAIAALTIAVAEIVGMGVMITSFRENVEDWLVSSLQSDIYVSVAGRNTGISVRGIDPDVIESIAAAPGVSHYSAARNVWLEKESGRTRLQAVDLTEDGFSGFDFLEGEQGIIWPAFEAGSGVIVSDPYAYRHDVKVGDTIILPTELGDQLFTLLGVYRDYNSGEGVITITRQAYMRHWQDNAISSLGIYLREGADRDAVVERLNDIAAPTQALLIGSNERIKEISLAIFDRTFIITNVLYWLAMIVAFVGVLAAALALSLERGKELAILRSLGMTTRQITKLIVVQCGSMGLLAGLFALPVGVVSGWLLIDVINRRAFGWHIDMILPIDTLIVAFSIAVLTALIASIYPAWVATRNTPVATLREE